MKRILNKPYDNTRIVRQTSIDCYMEMLPKLGKRETEVYQTLKRMHQQGMRNATDMEITTFLNKKDPNYVRPRRNALSAPLEEGGKYGLVVLDCKRECSITHKRVMAWRIKE